MVKLVNLLLLLLLLQLCLYLDEANDERKFRGTKTLTHNNDQVPINQVIY